MRMKSIPVFKVYVQAQISSRTSGEFHSLQVWSDLDAVLERAPFHRISQAHEAHAIDAEVKAVVSTWRDKS